MRDRASASILLARAAVLYDEASGTLAPAARCAWRKGFPGGAAWMQMALARIRGTESVGRAASWTRLGLGKYGLALSAALAPAGAAWALGIPALALLAVPAFYAVEAPLAFVFPAALDGAADPAGLSRALCRRAGGTRAAMAVILPIATAMLMGGFAGRGFLRSWCLGCLAVCIWYEDLRGAASGGEP